MGEQPANLVERPLSVDTVVKQLCDTSELSRHVVRLVKLWAVNHGLASHHEGYMNGVAWTLLVIFFLQKENLLPSYAALTAGSVRPPSQCPTLSALLRSFFEFLAARVGNSPRGLSVIHAQEYRAHSCVLFLEDPAEFLETRQQHNLAGSVGEAQWSHVLDEANKAAERLSARPQRWFHWAEVFDPREIPMSRLQPLAHWINNSSFTTTSAGESKGAGFAATSKGGKGITPPPYKGLKAGGKKSGSVTSGPASLANHSKGTGCRGFGPF